MDARSRTFLRTWVAVFVVFIVILGLANLLVDPYLVFGMNRVSEFNLRKPAVETQERLMKAYDVLRAEPKTVTLGNSRIDWGVDAADPAWPARDRPVYTLALAGSPLYESHRYLQHLLAHHHVTLVVQGVDFDGFLDPNMRRSLGAEAESRLMIRVDGSVNTGRVWQHARDVLHAVFSLDALTDSTSTLLANLSSESPDMAPSGNWVSALNLRRAAPGGYFRDTLIDMWFTSSYEPASKINQQMVAEVQAIINLCQSNETDLVLVINPLHADALELLDLAGHWQAFEEWKREMTALTAKYKRSGSGHVVLWDFTDYDSYSTESFPTATGNGALHWFFDPQHASKALGDAVIKRISGSGNARFGELLETETIETHLVNIRERREIYRTSHPADVRRIRALYNFVVGSKARG